MPTIEHSRARAHAVVNEIESNLPSEEHVRRFHRRHAGFIHSHFLTNNHQLSLLYAHRLNGIAHPHDEDIGKVIKDIVPKHFPE